MAVIRFRKSGLESVSMRGGSPIAELFDEIPTVASSTRIKFVLTAPGITDVITFSGVDLAYTLVGGRITDITAGTIAGISEVFNGSPDLSVTGYAISAVDLFDAILAGDIRAQRSLLLDASDAIFGTDAPDGDDLLGQAGNDTIYGYAGSDTLDGGIDDDRLFGGVGDDMLKGGANKDKLYGGTGNDTLIGGSGSDTLVGGDGDDSLIGSASSDVFEFGSHLNALTNIDSLADFQTGKDKLRLDDKVFTEAGATGGLADDAFHNGSAAADAEDRVIYNAATGALSYDLDGTGDGAAVQFAQLSLGTSLGFFDIFVF